VSTVAVPTLVKSSKGNGSSLRMTSLPGLFFPVSLPEMVTLPPNFTGFGAADSDSLPGCLDWGLLRCYGRRDGHAEDQDVPAARVRFIALTETPQGGERSPMASSPAHAAR
jgi:hypothetical protein